jgi:hypothetical protein
MVSTGLMSEFRLRAEIPAVLVKQAGKKQLPNLNWLWPLSLNKT